MDQQKQEAPEPAQKKRLDPDTNIIHVSQKKRISFLIFLSKIFLNKFDTVELHALGQAIQNCARVAESLKQFGLAQVTKIYTSEYDTSQEENRPQHRQQERNDHRDGPQKKVKMVIVIKKSEKFHDLVDMENL